MRTTLDAVRTAPGRVPIFGHLASLLVRPLPFVRSLPKYGDVVRIYFGGRPVYAVTSPALLRELVVVHANDCDKGSIFEEGKTYIGEGLITSAGELHHQQRRMIQPGFNPPRVAEYVPSMRDAALGLSGEWHAGQPVELGRAMMRVAFRAITGVMFSGALDPDAEERLVRSLRLLIRTSMVRALAPDFVRRLPLPMNRDFLPTAAGVHQIIDELLRRCAADPDRPPDLVHLMQTAEPGMNRQQQFDELVNIMVAGTETTGAALAWTWYELATRPEVGIRVYQEIDRVVGTRPVTAADLDALEYSHRVLCEVLRQRSVWISTRRALRPLRLGEWAIPAGTEMAFSLYALHHDPALYPRPDEFDPDRWLPGVEKARPRGSFIPFLDGNRKCLGEWFAWTEMLVVLATIAARWRLRPAPGVTVHPVPLATIRPSRMTMLPEPRTGAGSARQEREQEVRL
ncbi:MAG TPA: cytochrome P450 [Actinophytocola sp.]|uniref:cytochrome P450 n=1 Tax=Actinophytocola sp. TaxID=1872138 RepID=UPI002DB5AFD4|nr:cytochrome P450 [Actinophytocola sp.]HEU5471955.1 cytochrome P450 [Actinophytocola sp.]